jgi:Mn2+/Fe2+ NRAMP family transporter
MLVVAVIVLANVANLGADLAAMADVLCMLIGGSRPVYAVLFAVACAGPLLVLRHDAYVGTVKWASLALLVYFATAASAPIAWGPLLQGTFWPSLPADGAGWTVLVAVVGTTISPYLVIWQSSLEGGRAGRPAIPPPAGERRRIRLDTAAGMLVAGLVAYVVVVTAAATLHPPGGRAISGSAEAAAALRPALGRFAGLGFSLGIIATGLLAVPMLAGSAAFAVAESFGWPASLARRPREAPGFYGCIVIVTLAGTLLTLLPIDPIRGLIWSAIGNEIAAVPVLGGMMLAAAAPDLGTLAPSPALATLGWMATALTALIAIAGLIAAIG